MEQSFEEFRLDEPIGLSQGDEAAGEPRSSGSAADPQAVLRPDIETLYANPLRDEPSPTVIAAVKRFGIAGLVACALGAGLRRLWRSSFH